MKSSAKKWDVRVEKPEEAFGMNATTGKWSEYVATRIRYRERGSKGRFESMFVVGLLPEMDVQELVDGHVKLLARQRQGGD